MKRGIIFTLGIALIGSTLFAFSVAHDLASKAHTAENRVMELERASSQASNLAHNVGKAFRESSGIRVGQMDNSLAVEETLPNDLGEYDKRIGELKIAAEALLNATVDVEPNPHILSGVGINYTHVSDRRIMIGLANDTTSITLSGTPTSGPNNCTLVYETGPVELSINITGDGVCIRNQRINMSAENTLEIDDGTIVLEIDRGGLSLEDDSDGLFDYTLTVQTNRTGYASPPILAGEVTVEAGSSRKTTEVTI